MICAATGEEGIGNGYLPRRDHGLLLIGWEKLRLNMMIGRVFGNNEVRINCVDFCHDSAITKQALMALTAPKTENLGNF